MIDVEAALRMIENTHPDSVSVANARQLIRARITELQEVLNLANGFVEQTACYPNPTIPVIALQELFREWRNSERPSKRARRASPETKE